MILAVLVGLGAAVGAVSRYLLDRAVAGRFPGFPAGTWVINVSGSLLLGVLAALATRHGLSANVVAVVGTGVCGGYTTFSTFNFETVRLAEEGAGATALVNIGASVAAGLAAAAVGLGIGLL
ncbi:MAG: fluoride efflux transporter CrcB [Actinocrinis sp.]